MLDKLFFVGSFLSLISGLLRQRWDMETTMAFIRGFTLALIGVTFYLTQKEEAYEED